MILFNSLVMLYGSQTFFPPWISDDQGNSVPFLKFPIDEVGCSEQTTIQMRLMLI